MEQEANIGERRDPAMARSSRVRVSDRCPYFFKVFFPQLSSEHLMIPSKFRKHIEVGKSSNTVSLKGPSDRIWSVGLVKNSDGLFFENGWKEFATDHALSLGDLLVFRYDGRFCFTVLLFDDSACEKDEAFSIRPCQECITVLDMTSGGEEPSRALVVSSVQATPKRKRGIDDCLASAGSLEKKRSSAMKVPSVKLQSHSHQAIVRKSKSTQHSGSLLSLDERAIVRQKQMKGRVASRLPVCRPMNKKPMSSNRYREILNKVKLISPSGLVVKASPSSRTSKSPSSSEKQKKISKTSASIRPCKAPLKRLPLIKSSQMPRRGEVVVKKQRQGGLKSQRRPVTDEELFKALQMAKSFKSENPFFILEMQESHVYYGFSMNVPQTFAKEHFPKKSIKVNLWDPNGKKWKVSYLSYWRHGSFSAGWSRFSCTNNLEKGDVCVFELIKKYDMRVYIFRVVEELTPLIRNPKG